MKIGEIWQQMDICEPRYNYKFYYKIVAKSKCDSWKAIPFSKYPDGHSNIGNARTYRREDIIKYCELVRDENW